MPLRGGDVHFWRSACGAITGGGKVMTNFGGVGVVPLLGTILICYDSIIAECHYRVPIFIS